MGFHICEYCTPGAENQYDNTSSGDTTLVFDSGRSWVVPDMILHYVADHGWAPPTEFINDILHKNLIGGSRIQTKSVPEPIGYLSGPFEKGPVPPDFVRKLQIVLRRATAMGSRVQYRGVE